VSQCVGSQCVSMCLCVASLLLRNIYNCSEIEPNENYINTRLSFTEYMQLKLKSKTLESIKDEELCLCSLNTCISMDLNTYPDHHRGQGV